MKFLRNRWRHVLFSIALLSAIGAAGVVWKTGAEIASPPRRALQDYHHEFLTNPAARGVTLSRFTASDGTPYFVCTPLPDGTAAERGTKIRQQLIQRGLHLPPSGKAIGTLVLLHGRMGRKEDYLPIAERFCAVGFRCVIPDLPAHGEHPTDTITYGVREAELPARILSEAAKKFHFDPQPSGLLGRSMGGSVAVHSAALPDAPWKSLVVICSFDSFPKVIESQASRYIGTTFGPLWAKGTAAVYQQKTGIPLSAIQPRDHAAFITIPTLVTHGTEDQVCSLACGHCLFKSFPATTPKKWIEIPDADHDNVLITAYPIYADIAEWMLAHVPNR
jgi:pimeloyl-ACP methyl ester carboxylesterase